MSRHLRLLRECGLVAEESIPEDARVRVIRLQHKPIAEMRVWLDEVECFWVDQLGAFKTHIEKRGRERRASRRAPVPSQATKPGYP